MPKLNLGQVRSGGSVVLLAVVIGAPAAGPGMLGLSSAWCPGGDERPRGAR